MNPHHAYDTISFLAAAVATSGAAAAIAHPSGELLTSAMLWSLLPLIGAILISGMSFLLGSVDEPRKKVFGRALGAILFGVAGPRFALYYKPDLANMVEDPILMVAAGAGFGLVGYAVCATLINWVMIKAPSSLENKLNHLIHENNTDIPTNGSSK